MAGGPVLFNAARGRTDRPTWGEALHIDWSNPLAEKLIAFTSFTTGVGPPIDSVSGRFGEGLNNMNWAEDGAGQVMLDGVSTSPNYGFNNKALQHVTIPFTIMTFGEIASGAGGMVVQTSRTNGVKSGVRFRPMHSTNQVLILCCDATGSSSSADRRAGIWTGATVIDTPTMYTCTVFEGGGTPVVADLYIDGIETTIAQGTANSGGVIGYSETLTGFIGDPSENNSAKFYAYGIWTRILCPQEVADLAFNPYQLLIGQDVPIELAQPEPVNRLAIPLPSKPT